MTTDKWNRRFLELAQLVSSWSKDPSTKCGSVIVRPDKTVASVGYNGFPRGTKDDPELYNDRAVKYERVVHAECNAILNAKEPLDGCQIYIWPLPSCANCSAHIIQAGIKDVHFFDEPEKYERWADSVEIGRTMYSEAGIGLHRYNQEWWNA